MFGPGKFDPVFQELAQTGKMGVAHEHFFVVMVEDTAEYPFDFLAQGARGKGSPENIAEGVANQNFFRPVQEIVKPSQANYIEAGEREGQETEQPAVKSHLQKFAQGEFGKPQWFERHGLLLDRGLISTFSTL